MQTHPMTKIQTDADINIINVLRALSSTFPIIYFRGIMITPTYTKIVVPQINSSLYRLKGKKIEIYGI